MLNIYTYQFKAILDDLKVDYVQEYKFDQLFNRKFRFDFAILDKKIAFEIDGGTFSGGRHVRGIGYNRDLAKYFIAGVQHWRILTISTLWFTHHKRKKYAPHLLYYEDMLEMIKNFLRNTT